MFCNQNSRNSYWHTYTRLLLFSCNFCIM